MKTLNWWASEPRMFDVSLRRLEAIGNVAGYGPENAADVDRSQEGA